MSDYYILVGQTPVPVECDPYTPQGIVGLLEWGRWFEDPENRIVKREAVLGLCEVSTVFLGIDHGFGMGRPILFETMALWGAGLRAGEEQDRCSAWLEAEAMHARMCREVARPRAVLAYLGRAIGEYLTEARNDWKEAWRELRGIGPERSDDPLWQNVLDSMARLKEFQRKRSFE